MERSKLEMLLFSAKGFVETGINEALKIDVGIKPETMYEVAPKAIVNLTFGAELWLKFVCWHYGVTENIAFHNLLNLFNKVPADVRNEIANEYYIRRSSDKSKLTSIKLCFNTFEGNPKDTVDENDMENLTLDEFLKLHSHSFVEWRYHFENKYSHPYFEYNFKLMFMFIKSVITVLNNRKVLLEPPMP